MVDLKPSIALIVWLINSRLFVKVIIVNAISEIPVSFKYEADAEGKLHKAYDLSIDMKKNADYWSVRVNAQTGNILSKNNWTVYCNHDHNKMSISDHSCKIDFIQHTNARHNSAVLGDGASYRVYPFPAESPLQSDPVLLVDPSDAEASPLGWHDTDGMDGAEYTITRGNNVHAYIDSLSNNNSVGGEPEGGENLVFDFTHDQSNEPNKNTEAAQVNLFYANNFLHDFTYNLGFNEVAGNFQANNYSGEGNDSDYVRAEAIDGSGVNNANFSTPPDGGSGRMQMYLWDNPGGASFASINSPAELAGTVTTVGEANYGQPIAEGAAPISGKAVLYSDGTQFGSQACNAATNSSELAGNIAIIDRGSCEFGRKSLNAEEAGAEAVHQLVRGSRLVEPRTVHLQRVVAATDLHPKGGQDLGHALDIGEWRDVSESKLIFCKQAGSHQHQRRIFGTAHPQFA